MRETFAEDQSIPVVEIAYDERALRISGTEEIEVNKSLSIAVADCDDFGEKTLTSLLL